MKLTAQLAYNQLRINRNRTLFTLLGIVLSTAVITSVVSLVDIFRLSTLVIVGDPAQEQTLLALALIPASMATVIIVAMSVIVISNGFRVSANERIAQFGMLKSVGATSKQITHTVMYESLWLSAVGVPTGLLLGQLLTFITILLTQPLLNDINAMTQIMIESLYIRLAFVTNWQAVLIATAISFVTVLYSAWKPAKQAAKLSAIDAIRGAGTVQVKKTRPNLLLGKAFGFEGTLAAKFLGRSRRHFRASVRALSIAIILMLVASSLIATLNRIENLMLDAITETVSIEYLSARTTYQDPVTGQWVTHVHAPIDNYVAHQIAQRLSQFDNTAVISFGGVNAYPDRASSSPTYRIYAWGASPTDIPGFMAYARQIMQDFFPHDPRAPISDTGFSIRVFESHDFIRIMNLGITVGAIFVYSFITMLVLIGIVSTISAISTNVRLRQREFAVLRSVGMTTTGLRRMMSLESLLCSLTALTWGVPLGLVATYVIHLPIRNLLLLSIPYQLPWGGLAQVAVGVIAIIWLIMRIAVSRLPQAGIVDQIRAESSR